MKQRPELVVFDIDGTLLATDAFWLDIGRSAVATVYRRHGIARDLPDDHRFLQAIGLPMTEFWLFVLPEDLHGLENEIELEAQGLEQIAFGKGLGAMYPGARQLLDDLHAAGTRLALASNCGRRYLDAFLDAFELRPIVDEAKCLDSPGISSKVDMVRDILVSTGARDAVMVGDRANDRESAIGNRIPFILFAGGFHAADIQENESVARDYSQLRALLLPESERE
jgi:phosphoglycolate phosphatase-like HAD superfamily hydrolase